MSKQMMRKLSIRFIDDDEKNMRLYVNVTFLYSNILFSHLLKHLVFSPEHMHRTASRSLRPYLKDGVLVEKTWRPALTTRFVTNLCNESLERYSFKNAVFPFFTNPDNAIGTHLCIFGGEWGK